MYVNCQNKIYHNALYSFISKATSLFYSESQFLMVFTSNEGEGGRSMRLKQVWVLNYTIQNHNKYLVNNLVRVKLNMHACHKQAGCTHNYSAAQSYQSQKVIYCMQILVDLPGCYSTVYVDRYHDFGLRPPKLDSQFIVSTFPIFQAGGRSLFIIHWLFSLR